jgi:hypothetical protein
VEAEFAGSYNEYEAGRPDITCAVFYWVCKKLKVLYYTVFLSCIYC